MIRLPAGLNTQEAAIGFGLRGISTRSWWGFGCHTSPAFEHLPRRHRAASDTLPATAALAHGTIGLPFFHDLTGADIARIGEALAEIAPLPPAPLRRGAGAAASRPAAPAQRRPARPPLTPAASPPP